MKVNLYSVKDVKTGFTSPFEAENNGTALRVFEEALKNPQSILSKHPRDMEIYHVGYFDKDNGKLEQENLEYLASGKDFVEDKKFKELDEETLKKVLDELIKITEEQERERKAFIEVKDKLKIIDEKSNKNYEKVEFLLKNAKIKGKKKYE